MIVRRQCVELDSLSLDSGETIAPVTVAYESYGELNAERSNAVLLTHAFTGDAHVAGVSDIDGKPGWWDAMVGPGKAFDTEGADRFNERIRRIWPELREECLEMAVPRQTLRQYLDLAGGPTSAQALGIPIDFYREAVAHGHEMRNRFSFADIACDSGVIHELAAAES